MKCSSLCGIPLALLLVLLPVPGMAQVVYSQNFDSGTPGESLTDPQFGFVAADGDLKLGPAQHGWSGNSVIGNNANPGTQNILYKTLAIPIHGLVEFNLDMYSGTVGNDISIELWNGPPNTSGTGIFNGYELEAVGDHWAVAGSGPGGSFWTSPPGLHGVPVNASLYWNQDTGENWATVTNGTATFSSPHSFNSTLPVDTLAIDVDRRQTNQISGDVDNLTVRMVPSGTPEPVTLLIGVAGAGLFLRRRNMATKANA